MLSFSAELDLVSQYNLLRIPSEVDTEKTSRILSTQYVQASESSIAYPCLPCIARGRLPAVSTSHDSQPHSAAKYLSNLYALASRSWALIPLSSLVVCQIEYPLNYGRRFHCSIISHTGLGCSTPIARPNSCTAPCARGVHWCRCIWSSHGIQAAKALLQLQPSSLREESRGFWDLV